MAPHPHASPPARRRIAAPEDGQLVHRVAAAKRYSFPVGDVVLLPVANTTTEDIAGWLLAQLMGRLDAPGVRLAELVLAEASDTSVMVSAQPGAGQ